MCDKLTPDNLIFLTFLDKVRDLPCFEFFRKQPQNIEYKDATLSNEYLSFDHGKNESDKYLVAYTDGATSNNQNTAMMQAGFGVYWENAKDFDEISLQHVAKSLGNMTNNRAELLAIERCLIDAETVAANLTVHTDSKYSILSIGKKLLSKQSKYVNNDDILNRIAELINRRIHKVELK